MVKVFSIVHENTYSYTMTYPHLILHPFNNDFHGILVLPFQSRCPPPSALWWMSVSIERKYTNKSGRIYAYINKCVHALKMLHKSL